MTGITYQPTRDGNASTGIGGTKTDERTPTGDSDESPAGEFNHLLETVAGLAGGLGLGDGSTPGSISEVTIDPPIRGKFRICDDFELPLDSAKWTKTGTGAASTTGVSGAPGSGFGLLTLTVNSGQTENVALGSAPIVGGNGMQPTLRFRFKVSALVAVMPWYIAILAGGVYIKVSGGSANGFALSCASVAGGSSDLIDNVGVLATGTWYDVVATFDGTTAILSVGGIAIGTVATAGAMPQGSEAMGLVVNATGLSGSGNTLVVDYIDVRGNRL